MFVDSVLRRLTELSLHSGTHRALVAQTLVARAALERSITLGHDVFARAPALSRLQVAARSAPSPTHTTQSVSGPLGFVRTVAIPNSFDPAATPAWARGMYVAQSVGPIVDEFGLPFWVDIVMPMRNDLAIARGPGQTLIALVHSAAVNLTHSGGNTTITFGPGSVWFVASLLNKAAPASSYAGIAFSGATLSIPGNQPPPVLSRPLILGPSVTAEFRIAPAASSPYVGSMHNDGADATVTLPTSLDLFLAPAGIQIHALSHSSVTVYGTTTNCPAGSVSVQYDTALSEIAVVYNAFPTLTQFSVTRSISPTLQLEGQARVLLGAYRIPVALTSAAALGTASSGGAMSLSLASGLRGSFGNTTAPAEFDQLMLHVQTGVLGVQAVSGVRPFIDTYALWDARAAGSMPRAASITLTGPRGSQLMAQESSLGEILALSGCRMEGHLDRPLLARGTAPSLGAFPTFYGLVRTSAGEGLIIESAARGDWKPTDAAQSYVIENAVLLAEQASVIVMLATLVGKRATSGTFIIGHVLDGVTPTLPDPYAALQVAQQNAGGSDLIASVTWTTPADPRTAFLIFRLPLAGVANAGASAGANATATSTDHAAWFASTGDSGAALYDVSSAENQFGVAVSTRANLTWQVVGQQLLVDGNSSALFTVPSIAWEPVIDLQRQFFFPMAQDDGGPTTLSVPTVTLRPFEPGAFIEEFLIDYAKGADLIAQITLPFGLKARIDTRTASNNAPPVPRPTMRLAQAQFPAEQRSGGKQLRLDAVQEPYQQQAVMPGYARAGDFVAPGQPPGPPDSEYVHAILDDTPNHDIASFWNQDFGGDPPPTPTPTPPPPPQHFVPLSRYDLSGYGASLFSDFKRSGLESGVVEARFDVVVGRTSYELVQVQSFILPWAIPVVNTTIFVRDATGYVMRTNSGWQAKGPGRFAFNNISLADIETGGIQGVFNVHNITELPGTISLGANVFSRVQFDADVFLTVGPPDGLTVTGGDPGGRLPSSGLTGYLELASRKLPELADAILLVETYGVASGPIAAEVSVFGTNIALALTGVEVTATRPGLVRPSGVTQTLAVALRGTPHLPRDGSWSIGVRQASSTVAQPVPPTTPVPLVRELATPGDWHIAEGADVGSLNAPQTLYGYLQSTGANRVFFEHPVMSNVAGANPLNFNQTPKLADVGKLLGDTGLLPDIASLLDFGAFDGLKPAADGLALSKTLTANVDLGKRVLIPLGPIQLLMASWSDPPAPNATSIALALDASASPRWKIDVKNIAFQLAIDGWGGAAAPLIIVHGDMSAAEGSTPNFANIDIKYGPALSIVKHILTQIETFLAFLPGVKDGGLQVSFAGTKLRVRENFPIPKLPIGVGYMEDISLKLGFDVDVLSKKMGFFIGLGDTQTPFHWLVSPLSGNGMLQLGASDQLGVVMEAGIGVGLAIDLAILSGSASIVIAVRFDATRNPIGVMVLLTGQASVDVLDGLASASLSLTAGVGVAVQPGQLVGLPPDPIEFLKTSVIILSAEVAVGVHISVCWLVHVDFDGSWPFSETISGQTLAALV
jgi:hypothetical protein